MNFEEIQELIKLVKKSELTDFKLTDKDFKIRIRTKKYYNTSGQQVMTTLPHVQVAPIPVAPPVSVPAQAAPVALEPTSELTTAKNTIEVKSPIVGTFYRSPGPDKPVFAKVGDTIKAGDVVCIIEAMKLFNEIESDVSGTVVKICVEDAAPVEYDQVLFLLEV